MIFNAITIGGSDVGDTKSLRVNRAISETNQASDFNLLIDSPFGRHKTDYNVGDDVIIKADQDAAATTTIFRGIVESKEFEGEGLNQRLRITGRDYSARLMDNTVEPVVYTNTEIGSIVRNIVTNNLSDIGSVNVTTTQTTLPRIAFNQNPVYDAINTLADLAGYSFYVDTNKDLHFELVGSSSTGLTFGSGNIIEAHIRTTRENMGNKVWVYGDRYLAGFREILDSQHPGSVYTLQFKPHHSEISTNLTGGSVLKGGILGLTNELISGTDYLVNFHDKQLVFVSGTQVGYSTIPSAAGSVIAIYDREIPIVKYGENRQSISSFGAKTRVINDKTIRDPNTAVQILNAELKKSDPLNNMELELRGWFTFSPGQTANVSIPDYNISQSGVQIISMNYNFSPVNNSRESVISIKLDKKEVDITDKIADLKKRLDLLEGLDRQSTDVYTRLETTTGSFLMIGSYYEVRAKWHGSEFRVWPSDDTPPRESGGVTRLGLLNSSVGLGTGSISYLASGTFGHPLTILTSGGYSY